MKSEYTENVLQVKAHDDTRTYNIKTKEFDIKLSIYSTIKESVICKSTANWKNTEINSDFVLGNI